MPREMEKRKHAEACASSAKASIDHTYALFQFHAPSQAVNDALSATNQHNQISNESDSNLCSDARANEQLPYSNVMDLVEMPI